MSDLELFTMAYLFASDCTKQEEKFGARQRGGCPWRWVDCEAAYDLIKGPQYYEMFRQYGDNAKSKIARWCAR